jgi:predicted permease
MTNMNAITEIFEIVVPVFCVLLIGYISERAQKFDSDQVQGIYELVLDFALHATPFVGTVL